MQARGSRLTTTMFLTTVLVTAAGCGPELEGLEEGLFGEHDHEDPPAPLSIDVARGIVEQTLVDCSAHQDTGYSGGNAFPITVVTVDGKPVERDTANAFWVMQQAAAADGVYITISSGFRTMAQQEYFYGCYVNCNCNNCNLAAYPGYSNHQSGHALDLNTSTPGVLSWLNAHGAYYGFSRTVSSEPWHWEWWGGGPGGGICGLDPKCHGDPNWGGTCNGNVISSCENGHYSEGDCGVFGAQCSTSGGRAHCVHFSCWTNLDGGENGSFCKDDTVIATCEQGVYSEGDCGAYGGKCSDAGGSAHCVHFSCWTNLDGGENGSFCKDDTVIATCDMGQYSEGNCGAYGAKCSEAGGSAHCVHWSCWTNLDGGEDGSFCLDEHTVGSCTLGAFSESSCAPESPCVENEQGAACGGAPVPPPPPPPSGSDEPAGEGEGEGEELDDDDGALLQGTAVPVEMVGEGEPSGEGPDVGELPPSVSGGCAQASSSAPAGALFGLALLLARGARRRRCRRRG